MTFDDSPALTPALPPHLERVLRDYQVPAARHLFGLAQCGINTVQLSDTGTGKTYVACAVAFALNRPTLVVVPKVAITSWQRACEAFGDKLSIIGYEALRTGRSPYGWWDNTPPSGFSLRRYLYCAACHREVDLAPGKFVSCYCRHDGIHCVETKKRAWNYGQFHFAPQVRSVIFDEVHRCGAMDSLNADMLFAIYRQNLLFHGMSATLAADPLKLRALGLLLGLHKGDDFFAWASRYGARRDPRFRGWKWLVGAERQAEVMADIRTRLIPGRGVRLSCEDIPGFPERDITAELYDLDDGGVIDRLYVEMEDALAALEKVKEGDKAPDLALTILLRAAQKIELLKVPLAVELTQDSLERGESVAIFINFKQTMAELRKRLKCDCFIDGSPEGVRYRQSNIDAFQANQCPVILVNSQAGGVCVSLHDLWGGHPRTGYVMPCFSATALKQDFGRLHRDGGKTKCHYRVLLAAGTVEVKMHRALQGKLNNLDALNDADLCPGNLTLARVSASGLFNRG
jgi:hypothetical protein